MHNREKVFVALVIFCIPAVFVNTASAAVSGSTATATNHQDAAALVYISGYEIDPPVFFPYDTGTVTVHVTNAGNSSVGISQPDLISKNVQALNTDAFSTMTQIGPGATTDYIFLVSAEPPEGTYLPLFTVSPKAWGMGATHSILKLSIDSTPIRASISKKPDSFSISQKDTINVTVVNPWNGDVTDVLIMPLDAGADVTPSESNVGTLRPHTPVDIPFQITPSHEEDITFDVSYRNGDNRHGTNTTRSIMTGEDKLAANPLVNNIAIATEGNVYKLTGDLNNAVISDAKSMVITVASPARAVEPYPEYAIGSLASDDFSSFELTFTSDDLSSVPLKIMWKDADGNAFSTVKNLDLRALSNSGTGIPRTGSSGTTGSSGGSSSVRFSGGPGGPGWRWHIRFRRQPWRRAECVLSSYRAWYCRHCFGHPLDETKMDHNKAEEKMMVVDKNPIPLIRLVDVTKVYELESGNFTALDHISLDISEGEFVARVGSSGSGKSTPMNQLGIHDIPTSGELYIDGRNVAAMTSLERTHMRRDRIGYIFQKFYLFPLLSAYENVEYPLILKYKRRDDSGKAAAILRAVGFDDEVSSHRPNQLSGGQQQRVAIARALVNDPKILLCDEPTGNLDRKTGFQIMDILSELNKKRKTVILVTHDPKIAEYAHRTIHLDDGRVVGS